MELKKYQKKVISDLRRYLDLMNQTGNIASAYRMLWEEKKVPVGINGLPNYQNILPGVPTLCLKVPTGGGKTLLACHAVKPIFDALPVMKAKVVVWLVPSDAILTQTLAALKNANHPYRQKINSDFGGRVEIYTKQELINGQNFNMGAVSEQLSIMVLSYDSFRGRKEALKARQENSNLAPMAKALGAPQNPLKDTDETALIQIINQLSPLVIVDESHHARSTLSKEMLKDFNPCFVLDLTATPTKESNVISIVDAVELKRENMVKLPVIVYNRDSQQEVIADAVDLRNRLEQFAIDEQTKNGSYIRPIVLFQAQPKTDNDNTTFNKLKDKLVEAGIPANEIAIKTADVNELKNIDLLSADCSIRYIITVNALREGWDCPFAYILATIANKTSRVDVEQILGRVLRQPHTKKHHYPALNMSYVLTSSSDFKATLDAIVDGLYGAGFSDREYRVPQNQDSVGQDPAPQYEPVQQELTPQDQQNPHLATESLESDEYLDFDSSALSQELKHRLETTGQPGMSISVDEILYTAEQEQMAFERAITRHESVQPFADVPLEVQDKMTCFHINTEFVEEVSNIKIPQFFMEIPINSLFADGNTVLLQKEHLIGSFTLKGKPYDIDFARADDEIVRVDIDDEESTPKVFKMSETDQRYFKEHFSKFTPEQKIKTCKAIIHRQLNKMDGINSVELNNYIDLIVSQMDKDQLSALEKSPQSFSLKIKQYIECLLSEHCAAQFNEWIEIGKIVCRPSYKLPAVISPLRATNKFGGSLYQAEEEVNGLEYDMVMALTSLQNIKWWHRNISRHGFCINGYINHYPDFIVMTKSNKIIMIETKGDYLENTESKSRLLLGRTWQNAAGSQYKYYMVFERKDLKLEGAWQFDKFVDLLKEM